MWMSQKALPLRCYRLNIMPEKKPTTPTTWFRRKWNTQTAWLACCQKKFLTDCKTDSQQEFWLYHEVLIQPFIAWWSTMQQNIAQETVVPSVNITIWLTSNKRRKGKLDLPPTGNRNVLWRPTETYIPHWLCLDTVQHIWDKIYSPTRAYPIPCELQK